MPQHILKAPATLPLNESTRPELVEFGVKSLRGENIRQFHQGEAGTRFGFEAMNTARFDGTTPLLGNKLLADSTTTVRICDGQAESYSSHALAWKPLGRVPEASARLIGVPNVGSTTTLEDIEATNGYVALSWMSANATVSAADSYLGIIDQTTGSIVSPPIKVGTNTTVSAAFLGASGNYFFSVRYNATGTKLEAYYLDTTSATTINTGWVAMADLCTDATATYAVHSLPLASTPRVAVAYGNTGAVPATPLTALTFDQSGVIQAQAIATTAVSNIGIGSDPSTTLWITWSFNAVGATVKVCGLDQSTLSSTLASEVTAFTMSLNTRGLFIAGGASGFARVFVTDTNTPFQSKMVGIKTTGGAAVLDGSVVIVPNARMCGKPANYNGRYYSVFFGGDTNNTQLDRIVCDWTEDVAFLRPIANPSPSLAPSSFFDKSRLVTSTASVDKVYFGMNVRRSSVTDGAFLCELDFASPRRWQPATWGNSLYLSGGIASCFDGARACEVGFLVRPTTPVPTVTGVGITGTFRYVCVYEEIDADGNWHQSGLSSPSVSVSPANQTVTVTTSPLTITARASALTAAARSLRVAFYRTATGGTAPYYRLGYTISDPSLGALTVSYADTTPDATLTANAKLYSQPGVIGTAQDRRAPPFFQCLTPYSGMLVGASGSDIWYSGQNVTGEGAWFNPIFSVPVPGDGDITGLAAMDGALFVFKRQEIYVISGDPPSDNASGGGLGTPRRLACDLGCVDSRSLCVTSLGIFFQSERGIEILTRAQAVMWIGQPMQDTVAAYPIVTSATVDPSNSGTVLIELAAAESDGVVTGNGRTLVFDLSVSDWISVDRRKSIGGTDVPSQSACLIYTGTAWRYAWMNSGGRVHYEDRTTYTDADGSFVVPLFETGWFNTFEKELRIWRASVLYKRYTAAGLKVEVAYNYGDYASLDTSAWTELQTASPNQLEMSPDPRADAVKFRISATAPTVTGTGQGLGLICVTLDIKAQQGPTKGTLRLDPALRK